MAGLDSPDDVRELIRDLVAEYQTAGEERVAAATPMQADPVLT